MKKFLPKTVFLSAVLAAASLAYANAAFADKPGRLYRVTITNAMHGQPVAPSVIVTHSRSFRFFELGPAPMEGGHGYDDYFALATMAETGYPFLVLDQALASRHVSEAVALPTENTPPVLFPSESNSTVIGASGRARYLSAFAMLGATNDAVYAVQGIPLPHGFGEVVRAEADVYDVGSEANAESAATIGALGATDDDPLTGDGINENGEGFIHIHAGIHGVGGPGGLEPAMFDWRNPGVVVTIERVK